MNDSPVRALSSFISPEALQDLIDRALDEDGARNDLTTRFTVEPKQRGIGRIRAKQSLVLSGLEAATLFFLRLDADIRVEVLARDTDRMSAGDVAATFEGALGALLAAERSALNLLQHLSGIATLTARFADRIADTSARILDTRKTIPGLRCLEKYAVHCGGGHNHRMGLHDAVLIKDNHAAAAGSVGQAVLKARVEGGADLFIEVEVGDLAQLEQAMDAGANRALLDNMDPNQLRRCVQRSQGRIELEASGNVSYENVRDIALSGVDFISIGALTHSAPAADLNMKIEPLAPL